MKTIILNTNKGEITNFVVNDVEADINDFCKEEDGVILPIPYTNETLSKYHIAQRDYKSIVNLLINDLNDEFLFN